MTLASIILFVMCLTAAAQSPPMPPGFKPVKRLLSPKASEQMAVQMAKPMMIMSTINVSNTCSIQMCKSGTNVAWTVTASTGTGKFYLDTSTNLVNWETILSWQNFCQLMPGVKISLTGYYTDGDRNERKRFFRNRTE